MKISPLPRWAPLAVLVLASFALGAETAPATAPDRFARRIEQAHGRAAWDTKAALHARFELHFGGEHRFDATIWMRPDTSGVRLAVDGGPTIVFDGESAWVAPADTGFDRPRFHVLTWPYFIAAPFKLRDPGTRLADLGRRPLRADRRLPAAKLTFASGVGDTPDDWYVVFRDAGSGRMAAMGYIVTYGRPREKAEEKPHAITYRRYRTIEGVTLSTRWRFWPWKPGKGIHGDPIGSATLSEIRFGEPPEGAFERPEGARRATLP